MHKCWWLCGGEPDSTPIGSGGTCGGGGGTGGGGAGLTLQEFLVMAQQDKDQALKRSEMFSDGVLRNALDKVRPKHTSCVWLFGLAFGSSFGWRICERLR